MPPAHSGLQKEVLALYRRALRMVLTKPSSAQPKFHLFVRYTFKTQAAALSPRDVSAVEHVIRKGRRQLEMYEDPNVRDCWVSRDMEEWQRKEGTTGLTQRRRPSEHTADRS